MRQFIIRFINRYPVLIRLHRVYKFFRGQAEKRRQFFLLPFRYGCKPFLYKLHLLYLNGDPAIPFAIPEYHYHPPNKTRRIKKQLQQLRQKPLISIIMPVYNTNPKWLRQAIQSVIQQWYPHWQLCIVDDGSTQPETHKCLRAFYAHPQINIQFCDSNQHISAASNRALEMAQGDYIGLLDHDDELTPDALFAIVQAINEQPADFIYSDEDKTDTQGVYFEPHYKPDYAPDHILSQNYISHFCVIKHSLIRKVGGFRTGMEGAQDYDLYLRVLPLCEQIRHIPRVLYHWRQLPDSTALCMENKSYAHRAGKKALEQAVSQQPIKAQVKDGAYPGTYRFIYTLQHHHHPLISIIIPFRDKPDLLQQCIDSIIRHSHYPNFEIIGINNQSREHATHTLMQQLCAQDKRIVFHDDNEAFNYSRINNYAVKHYARGDYLVLLNNDIEIISPNWLETLLQHAQQEHVGAVGAKLYYTDNTIQHAGVITGINLVAGHAHKRFPGNHPGYFSRLQIIHNVSAVTAACLMIQKQKYLQVGGLDEKNLAIAFNDVDFCLRLREKGYFHVFTPYCEAYHHESASRGLETTPAKMRRFMREIDYMLQRHGDKLAQDPFYNPNLTHRFEDFTLKRRYEEILLKIEVTQELEQYL